MAKKSKREVAFHRFRYSAPGWNAEVIPVAGASGDSAVVAAKEDPYTGRKLIGQTLAVYHSKVLAEKLSKDLNEWKAKTLATAYP